MIRLKPMRRLLALAALAMLAACGPPLTWTKPNVTEAEARLDYDECTGLARDQAFRESFFGYGYYGYGRFGPGYPWSPYGRAYSPFHHDPFMSRVQREHDLHAFCLRARGYRLTPMAQQ
jgi:hypothetical protein